MTDPPDDGELMRTVFPVQEFTSPVTPGVLASIMAGDGTTTLGQLPGSTLRFGGPLGPSTFITEEVITAFDAQRAAGTRRALPPN